MKFFVQQLKSGRRGQAFLHRPHKVEASELKIGRGTDCEIRLSDLAVGLHHAVLSSDGPESVLIKANDGQVFEFDGAFVRTARVLVVQQPKLLFGRDTVTLKPGDQEDEVVIIVEITERAAGGYAPGRDVRTAWSAIFSRRTLAWTASVSILVGCLGLPIWQIYSGHSRERTITAAIKADKQWSSGPLLPGHHFLETDCLACHQQAFVAVRDTACLNCHQAGLDKFALERRAKQIHDAGSTRAPYSAGDHAKPERLVNAVPVDPSIRRRVEAWFERTFNHPNNRCVSCHVEHVRTNEVQFSGHAAAPMAITAEALEALEKARPDPIAPVAMQNSCESCHTSLKERLSGPEVLDAADWKRHPEFRPLVTTSAAKPKPDKSPQSLSMDPIEKTGITFSHRQHMLRDGGVARMAESLGRDKGYGEPLNCSNCHKAEGGSFKPIKMTENCAICHSLGYVRKDGVVQELEHGKADKVVEQLRSFFASENPGVRGVVGPFDWRPGFGLAGVRNLRDLPLPPLAARVTNGIRAVFSRGGACYGCHEIVAPKNPSSLAYDVAPVGIPESYLPRGDFDHGVRQHKEEADKTPLCDTCHEAVKSDRATDVLLPSIAKCAACHVKNRDEVETAASAECTECHGYHNTAKPVARPRHD